MQKIVVPSEFFSVKDTLDCGQIFRYTPYNAGYLVFSTDKACFAETVSDNTVITADDDLYFEEFFDLKRNLKEVYERALSFGNDFLTKAAEGGKGVRLLRQNPTETLFSFIVSQNNNIPRIKKIIEKLCDELGEKKKFCGVEYRAFPTVEALKSRDAAFYKSLGLGYRAEYIVYVANAIANGDFSIDNAEKLSTAELKKSLLSLKGVGPKVADCVSLFGFYRYDSFPVDVWMDKIYREHFGGTLTDRNEQSKYFVNLFGNDAGYFQQYMFHYKRNLEKLADGAGEKEKI